MRLSEAWQAVLDGQQLCTFDNALPVSDLVEIRDWVMQLHRERKLFRNPGGPHRFDGRPLELEPPESWLRLYNSLGEPGKPAFRVVSLIEAGGFVHRHHDRFPNVRHVRLNVIVQAPERGGEPIIGDQMLSIRAGIGWAFDASQEHECRPVEGTTPRINLSFGWVQT